MSSSIARLEQVVIDATEASAIILPDGVSDEFCLAGIPDDQLISHAAAILANKEPEELERMLIAWLGRAGLRQILKHLQLPFLAADRELVFVRAWLQHRGIRTAGPPPCRPLELMGVLVARVIQIQSNADLYETATLVSTEFERLLRFVAIYYVQSFGCEDERQAGMTAALASAAAKGWLGAAHFPGSIARTAEQIEALSQTQLCALLAELDHCPIEPYRDGMHSSDDLDIVRILDAKERNIAQRLPLGRNAIHHARAEPGKDDRDFCELLHQLLHRWLSRTVVPRGAVVIRRILEEDDSLEICCRDELGQTVTVRGVRTQLKLDAAVLLSPRTEVIELRGENLEALPNKSTWRNPPLR